MNVRLIPIEKIVPDPNNPRQDLRPDDVEELAGSIQLHGVQVPLIGFMVADQILLCDGHCRMEAARSIGLSELPVHLLEKRPTEAELLAAQLTINGHRQSLNPLDQFFAFERLRRLNNWTPSDLAKGLAISNAAVTKILSIGKLTDEEQQLVRTGKIPPSSAYALSRVEGEQRKALIRKAVAGEITRDEIQARVRKKAKKVEKKTQRLSCQLAGGAISVKSALGLNLESVIGMLEELIRECRKARGQGLDVSTVARILQDRARVPSVENSGA